MNQATALAELLAQARQRLDAAPAASIEPAPADRYDPFPLSPMQQAYWVGRQDGVELGRTGCFVYQEVEIPALDPARIEAAWARLVARHEMLNVILTDDGRQRVQPDATSPPITRLQVAPADDAAARLATREAMLQRLLDGQAWPLYELRITDTGKRATLHVCIEAMVADGPSLRILLDELHRLYQAPQTELPPLALTYRDYVLNRARRSEAAEVEAARTYWSTRLATLPERPRLPLAPERPDTGRRFVRQAFTMPAPAWSRLKKRARDAGLTTSECVLAIVADVIAVWSEQGNFLLNLTVFDRLLLDRNVPQLVGDFSSLLLLACRVRVGRSFAERAADLQKQLAEALDHRAYSGLQVMRDLMRLRESGADAIAPVVFTSHLHEPESAGGWQLTDGVTQTPQVWLDIQVRHAGAGALACAWDAPEGLFAPAVHTKMVEAAERWMTCLADDPAAWHRRGAPIWACAPTLPVAECVPARTLPIWPASDGMAVVGSSHSVKAGELRRRAEDLAEAIRARGVRREAVVAVALPRGADAVAAQCGVLLAGAAFLPLDLTQPVPYLADLLQDSSAVAVVTGPGTPAVLAQRADALAIPESSTAAIGEAAHEALPRDLAYLIYTSGSTGRPKGVLIEHEAAANTVLEINRRYQVGPGDCLLWVSSPAFDLSVYDVFGTLAAGARLATLDADDSRDPAAWLRGIAQHGVTIWNSAPALMELLLAEAEAPGAALASTLRLVLLSGDWIPVTMPARIARCFGAGVKVVSLGGATEASIWSVVHDTEGADASDHRIPYGRALAGQRVEVRNAARAQVPDWVVGEIMIGGLGLARGYHGDAALTAASFVPCPLSGQRLYRTGDLGRRRADGVIELLGRNDRQFKVRGHRVEPGAIEAALLALPAVEAAVVLPHSGRVAAYVVPRAGQYVDAAGVRAGVAELMPAYLVPSWVIGLHSLPLTPSGKIDRGALPNPLSALSAEGSALGADVLEDPKDPIQNTVEDVIRLLWAETLGAAPASTEQDFFVAGGDSVMALNLHAQVARRFGVELALRKFFQTPTIAALAAAVKTAPPRPSGESVLVADPELRYEPFALSDVQQAYWAGREAGFELGNVAPHAYTEFERADIDLPRLEAALDRLVTRHDMLRAVVDLDGRQRVLPQVARFRIEVQDLRPMAGPDREQRLAEWRDSMSHRQMDPARWPLFEVKVSLLPDGVRLHVGIDLLIADAWSLVVLREELAELYANPQATLAPLPLTYRDILSFQQAESRSAHVAQAQRYWLAKMPFLPAAPALPTICRPADISAPRFRRLTSHLPPAAARRFLATAARHGVTGSAAIATAYAEVLAASSGQQRLCLNVSLFQRPAANPETHRVVGDFTSVLLLEAHGAGDQSFVERAAALQSHLLEALDHAAWSGVQLLRARAKAGLPGMPVVFTSMLGLPGAAPREDGWRPVWGISQTPQVWLDHQVSQERDETIRYHWDAIDGLFEPGLLDHLFDAYEARLRQLADCPDCWDDAAPLREVGGPVAPLVQSAIRIGAEVALEVYDRDAVAAAHHARRSVRFYEDLPVPLEALARLLTALMAFPTPGGTLKYRYASAGGIYPVHSYVLVRDRRVAGLRAGLHRYDPVAHFLHWVGEVDTSALAGEGNAGFAICLFAAPAAMQRVYGERTEDFCRIEAGLMAQALETEAGACGLGLCQLGGFPFGLIAPLLPSTAIPLHALSGGLRAGDTAIGPPAWVRPDLTTQATDPGQVATVARVWAELLGMPEVPPDQDFFELGGDSVLLVRLRNRLSEATGRKLSIVQLLQSPTVRKQAFWLQHDNGDTPVCASRLRGEMRRRQPDA